MPPRRSIPAGEPYVVRECEEDGVRLVGVHNRAHGLWDLGNPLREIDDPAITRAFAATLDRVRPDVVHFHNLHNLGAALIDEVAARGVPAYFTTHNYWLVCPRAYLMTGEGVDLPRPGRRRRDCASCVGSPDRPGHRERLGAIRERFTRGIDVCLAVSDAMRSTLVAQGYPAEMIDASASRCPRPTMSGRGSAATRAPGRSGERLDRRLLRLGLRPQGAAAAR